MRMIFGISTQKMSKINLSTKNRYYPPSISTGRKNVKKSPKGDSIRVGIWSLASTYPSPCKPSISRHAYLVFDTAYQIFLYFNSPFQCKSCHSEVFHIILDFITGGSNKNFGRLSVSWDRIDSLTTLKILLLERG